MPGPIFRGVVGYNNVPAYFVLSELLPIFVVKIIVSPVISQICGKFSGYTRQLLNDVNTVFHDE